MNGFLKIINRGQEDYSQTLTFQEQLLNARIADRSLDDVLVFVEHEEIYTVGRSVSFQSPITPKPVRWLEVGRGGQATFHGPGQLVAYPIFDLQKHGADVHLYLRKLETALIQTVERFGIQAKVRDGLTGVWVLFNGEWKKLASIGVGVRKWVSYHGVALNVSTDLSYFRAISPCGQSGESVTSMAEIFTQQQRKTPSVLEVQDVFQQVVSEVFKLDLRSQKVVDTPKHRPAWLKVKAPGSPEFLETNDVVRKLRLVTVCEEAHCPNIGECWSHHTATFMIMGELCTRRCSFCSVKDGSLESLKPLDPLEPFRVGKAIAELNLKHVVITSVNRDDLSDMGALHFDQTVKSIVRQAPDCNIELLIPDMRGKRELLHTILQSGQVNVLNHNVETVPRLYSEVRPGASFKRSLLVLKWAKEFQAGVKTKSGLMVGLGERRDEVLEVMDQLREAKVDILTIGQYLQPTDKQLPINRYVHPDEFAEYKNEGEKRGFAFVESGPLVRSSYHAWRHVLPSKDSSSCNLDAF